MLLQEKSRRICLKTSKRELRFVASESHTVKIADSQKKLQEYGVNMKPASLIKIWSKLKPLPLPYWTGLVGILAVAVNFFLQPGTFTNPWTIPATALNLLCLIAVPRLPLPTWAGYLVLFLLLSAQPDIRATAFTFFAPLVAAVVAYRGHTVAAAAGSTLIWYSGSVNPSEGVLFPPDLLASTVWALFLAAAVLLGHILYRVIIQRRDLMEQWDNDIRARRTSLARALHDSVAASLTSVVMRAETLSLQQGFAAETQAELAAIAEQARDSMKEVRSLLRILSSDSPSCSSGLESSAADQFYQIVSFLKAHGFTVETRGSFRVLSLNSDGLVVLREVLKEVATNIIKYANPGSTVTLTVEDHDGYVTISFINTVGSRKPASDLTTGLGLPAISQLAEGIGGDMRTVSSSTRWNTELRIPQQKQ